MLSPGELSELMYNPTPGSVNNELDITKRLYARDRIEERIAELEETKRQHVAFFDEEIRKARAQQEFLLSQIEAYLENAHKKNVKTPLGTVFRSTKQRVTWPDEAVLLAFSREHGIRTNVVEKPDKKAIAAFVEDANVRPIGFSVEEYTTLAVRKPKQEKAEEPEVAAYAALDL